MLYCLNFDLVPKNLFDQIVTPFAISSTIHCYSEPADPILIFFRIGNFKTIKLPEPDAL